MRTCTSCGRTLGKVATRCLYCGAAAADAPAASGGKPVLVRCPGCLRNARGAPGSMGTCAYCALWFQVDDEGVARVGRNPATPAATRAQVDALVADLPSARLWNVVRDILHRRAAYNELGAGEAERAIAALTSIATWPSAAPSWMPLPAADAPAVIPRAVFGVSDGAALQEYGHTVLLVLVGLKDRAGDTTGRAAVNLLGIASNVALGVGFQVSEDDLVQTKARVQIRARLVEQHGGVDLEGLANQIDQNRPTPLSPAQARDIHERIAGSRALLAGYYIAGALFGPSCRGGTAFSITRDAIAQRLGELGCDQSPELVEQLCIRMPPPFGN